MIFVTSSDGKPLFTAFVNGINEKNLPNGGVITNYILGTSEVKFKGKENEKKEYSSWFTTLIGEAKKKNEVKPLQKGDRILVKGFKQTNVSTKSDDGTYGKAYFNMAISNYDLPEENKAVENKDFSASEPASSDDELPF